MPYPPLPRKRRVRIDRGGSQPGNLAKIASTSEILKLAIKSNYNSKIRINGEKRDKKEGNTVKL